MAQERKLTKTQRHDPVVGGLMGLAVGDAFGVPVEFMSREEVRRVDLQEMEGNDSPILINSRWGEVIPSGAWSDDTSMTIAAMDAIIENRGEIDYDHIMEHFLRWWSGCQYCSLNFAFGLGGCVSRALENYLKGYSALRCGGTRFKDNGNGSLMRIFPFAIMFIARDYDPQQICYEISKASSITHDHDISKLSCFLYTLFLKRLLETRDPKAAYKAICLNGIDGFHEDLRQMFSDDAVEECAEILDINPDEIEENGYVVTSLKVALYSIVHTDNYEDAVKMAVNFGYDTDTNAAIVGSLAGTLYGYDDIPSRWLDKLKRRRELEDIAVKFSKVLKGGN